MILDFVVLVLRATLPFETIVMNVEKLLLTLLGEWQAYSCRKVAIREDEGGVFELESHADGTLERRIAPQIHCLDRPSNQVLPREERGAQGLEAGECCADGDGPVQAYRFWNEQGDATI